MQANSFGAKGEIDVGGQRYGIYRLKGLPAKGPAAGRLPISLRVLLENLLRHEDGRVVKREHVEAVLGWDPKATPSQEIAFHPGRVLLQDFTGVPAVVDLAAMREAFVALGGDPARINPLQPADLVIDHSVQVDAYASLTALAKNAELEHERNRERYAFLRWGAQAFANFRVVPPDVGICHQVNLEFLGAVVMKDKAGVAFPDTLVGTDSHTVMINGLGVVGWGVGGIEAEAAMLGQPLSMLVPEVVGFRLTGRLPEGATATDVVLTVTQMLRKKKVVGKFVEFHGEGIAALTLPDRATIANMAPEYGATIGFFPVDDETLAYLRFTGRDAHQVALVEAYSKEQGLFFDPTAPEPLFSDNLELDLATVVPSIAGPKRPQDRVPLADQKKAYATEIAAALAGKPGKADGHVLVATKDALFNLRHGSVVIAAITSCTNTSNPAVLLAAGLVAKRAVERGLTTKPWVKTSLAPGSRVVTEYLKQARLLPYLEALGFHVVGYGCTTCIGNSGPLADPIVDAIREKDLAVAAVLSGNRNFEGRIHPNVRLNYLASPPLVVAFALRGDVDADLSTEPVGFDRNGEAVYLKDLWPTNDEVRAAIAASVSPEQFKSQYADAMSGDQAWKDLAIPSGDTFVWESESTYVRRPPFFEGMTKTPAPVTDVVGARVLALLGDSVTTDHISPAGSIAKTSPAAEYLKQHGVEPRDFNSYGARRGNHEVMMRGTFANIRLKNLMLGGKEGGLTLHEGVEMSIYDAAMKYAETKTPLVVIAGAEYGTGSSRDWAAKGTVLLGVRAVIAKTFERIHRSNLVGMGVLPLQFKDGEGADTLGLTGDETIEIDGVSSGLAPGKKLTVVAKSAKGDTKSFEVLLRIDTPNEVDYYKHGGILQFVLRSLLTK
ncbi:MAG TPA: aconitate hydratase AcnA [Byssovorax sp.]|jgi:aconitate hydratase